ncbi:MAG: aminotransferase class V-fold PLP-dependent enzyme [Firmicutes bacterium]|jgi:cysteine desulfurase family protein|nr:aminotransferase class V-fold PLP-dependent enzyme [Bacillota bacterium]
MKRINFDQASTSFPKAPGVAEAVFSFLKEGAFNVNRGTYGEAYDLAYQIYEARENLSKFFKLKDSKYMIFIPGATIGINMALKGLLQPGDHVLCTSLEHNAVIRPLAQLALQGIEYTIIETNKQGILDLDKLEQQINNKTKAIVTTASSNVIGTFLPIYEISEICQRHGLYFIVDAAQRAGTFSLDMEKLKADALIVPGHKGLLGPQGIGAMAISEKFALEAEPLLPGGTGSLSHSLEIPKTLPDRFEAGTINLPGIIGLNAALKYLLAQPKDSIAQHELNLTQAFITGIKENPRFKLEGLDQIENRSPVVSISLAQDDPAELADLLERKYGILTRVGLHCSPLAHRTIGTYPQGTIRFSFGFNNNLEEVMFTLDVLKGLGI